MFWHLETTTGASLFYVRRLPTRFRPPLPMGAVHVHPLSEKLAHPTSQSHSLGTASLPPGFNNLCGYWLLSPWRLLLGGRPYFLAFWPTFLFLSRRLVPTSGAGSSGGIRGIHGFLLVVLLGGIFLDRSLASAYSGEGMNLKTTFPGASSSSRTCGWS